MSKRIVTIGNGGVEVEASIGDLLDHVTAEECVEYFGEDSILDEIPAPEVVKHFDTGDLLHEIKLSEAIEYYGENQIYNEIEEFIIESIDVGEFVNFIGDEGVLKHIDPKEALYWALKNDLTVTKEVLVSSLSSYYSYPELLKIFLGAIKLKEFKEE